MTVMGELLDRVMGDIHMPIYGKKPLFCLQNAQNIIFFDGIFCIS